MKDEEHARNRDERKMKEDILVAELCSQVPLKENTRVNESAEPTLSCIYFGQMSAFHMKIGGT